MTLRLLATTPSSITTRRRAPQITMLSAAGFDVVDCVWRRRNHAVFVAEAVTPRLMAELADLHPQVLFDGTRALSGSTEATISDRIRVSPETNAILVQRAAELMKKMPPLDSELVDMLVDNVHPVQWADEVKLLVRQVWIENDGRVTIEGAIASDSVDKLSPRS